jgi:ACT domain-containing protein
MEILNKLNHGYSIQCVMSQYGVSRSTLYDIKKIVNDHCNLCEIRMIDIVIKLKSIKGQLDPSRTKLLRLFTSGASNNILSMAL